MHPRDLHFKCDWEDDSELEKEEYPEDLEYDEDIDGEDFGEVSGENDEEYESLFQPETDEQCWADFLSEL